MVATPPPAEIARRCRMDRMPAIRRGRAGDHILFLGRVSAHRTLSKEPLLFHTGRFARRRSRGRRSEAEANLPGWLLVSQAQTLAEEGVTAHDPNNWTAVATSKGHPMRFIYLQHIPYRHLSEDFATRFPSRSLPLRISSVAEPTARACRHPRRTR